MGRMIDRLISCLKSLSERQILFLLLAIAFGLRLYAVLIAKAIALDSTGYGFMARDFLKGEFVKGISSGLHPFYPFLISLTAVESGYVEMTGRLISLLFGTVSLLPLYFLIREEAGKEEALFGTLLYAFHSYLVTYSGMLLSEATYWGLLTFSVYFFWTGLKRQRAGRTVISAFLLALAYLTRPEGIGYLFVFVVWIVFRGGIRRGWAKKFALLAGVLVPFVILIIPYLFYLHQETGQWLISKKALEAQGSLLSWTEMWTRGVNVVRYLPSTVYHYLRAIHFTFWLFLVFGLFRSRGKEIRYEGFIASMVLFHVISLATFNPSTIRFSIPVVPLSLFWAAAGVLEIRRLFRKRGVSRPMKWVSLLVAIILAAQLPQILRPERGQKEYRKKAGIWLRENTPRDTIVMGNSPIEIFYADREYVRMPVKLLPGGGSDASYDRVIRYAREKGVRYLLFNPIGFEWRADFLDSAKPSDLKKVYTLQKNEDLIFIFEVIYGP